MANEIFTIDLIGEEPLAIDLSDEDVLNVQLYSEDVFSIDLLNDSGGTYDYNALINKPSINGVELINDKTFEQLGREDIKNIRIKEIIDTQYHNIFGG